LSGLDPKYSYVVELHQSTTFEDICVLANRAEQQMKTKVAKRTSPKPFSQKPTFQQGQHPSNP